MGDIAVWFHWSVISGILDILVVSFLIYKFLLLVKGTRAMPMAVGLGMIVLVYVLSLKVGFVTLGWILGNFLGSVILVIVVLFQEDLRRALVKVGLAPGLGSAPLDVLESSIDEICQAADELHTRRLGALIVIQRNIGLDDYTETGVQLEARLSHQLLMSIFLPTSPIHDGAVIIRGNRVLASGVVLPLSFQPHKTTHYGTRHRAALGISELTDALVVVVSEETGAISLVREGRITRDIDRKTLSSALHRLLVLRQQREARRRKRWFRKLSKAAPLLKDDAAQTAPGKKS